MKVSIKDLAVNMDLGNTGVTFDVYDNDGKFLGDLRLGKGTVEWCKGKTHSGNGVKIKLTDLIQHFESKVEVKKPAAKKVARKKTTE